MARFLDANGIFLMFTLRFMLGELFVVLPGRMAIHDNSQGYVQCVQDRAQACWETRPSIPGKSLPKIVVKFHMVGSKQSPSVICTHLLQVG